MKNIFKTLLFCIVVILAILFIRSETFVNIMIKDINVESIKVNDMQMENSTFYYETLSDVQKKYYRLIGSGIMNLDENITIEITKDKYYETYKSDIEVALTAFLSDHPEVFFVNDKYEISLQDFIAVKVLRLKLNYVSKEKNEIVQMEEKLEQVIEKITDEAKSYKTDYEKELFIHDYIATSTSYYNYENYEDIPAIKHTAYSALVENSAVCDGITKAFQLVLSENDIESVFVTGSTEDVAHAWSKVKIDNDYYNVDLTSDKTLNATNKNLVVHSYFNVTDEEILKTHIIDNNDKLPQCTETKYDYYIYNNYDISHLDSFEYKLGKIIKSQSKRELLEVRVTGISDVPNKLITALYSLNFNNYKTNNVTKMEYNKINNNYIVVK